MPSRRNYNGLLKQDYHTAHQGGGVWEVTVLYRRKRPKETTVNFDTSGGTQHITQSIQTVIKKAATGSAPDNHGAIGDTGEAVEGVDITVPVFNFSETHYFKDRDVLQVLIVGLAYLTGKTNSSEFRGLAVGTVLLLGSSGSQRGVDDSEITFKFAGSANATGLSVGDISGIDKKGWEYLWVKHVNAVDADGHSLVQRPKGVYVEQVYQSADYSAPFSTTAPLGLVFYVGADFCTRSLGVRTL